MSPSGSDTSAPPAPRDAPRPPLAQLLIAALVGGAIAGAASGVIDGLWSWRELGQFVASAAGKLRLLLFLAAAYASVGALCGLGGALLLAFYSRATRLGDLWRHARATHASARERAPQDALAGLSLVLAGVPVSAALVYIAYAGAVVGLAERKHFGLVVAVAMAACVGALVLAALVSFALAAAIETGLRRLARAPMAARWLSAPHAPLVAALGLLAIAALAAASMAWQTLALLPLRPLWIAALALALATPSLRLGARISACLAAAGWAERRPLARRLAVPAGWLLVVAVALLCGRAEGVRKAAGAYSGLGGPYTRALRGAVDLDRDGFSPILGGGDCDDFAATVHPGADEIPDDGIDQNCVGGDPSAERSVDEVGFAPIPTTVPRDFNVLFITIDTIRADHLGSYGYERDTSPTLDAIAADGARFANGWAHAPSTRYSIPAILTGRYPLSVRYDTSIRGWPGLLPESTTIAEIMARAGLHTGAILNYWYFDRQRHMDQGFNSYDNRNQRYHKPVSGKGPAETQGSSSKQQSDKALAFIDQNAENRFFLWVHYYDPHFQYEAHPEVKDFGPSAIDRYDSEIRFTDHHIGRVIADLKRRGLYQKTIIVITGDHGEGFGEHGIDLHGYHLYAAQTKVPFIIRVPGLAPAVINMPVGHVDLLPTLANLAKQPASAEMQGRSLVDVMSGQADPEQDRVVFQQLSYENNNEMRAAASQRCHVIYNVSPDTSWELYRIDIDPQERRDVIDTPGPCGEVRATLEAWYDRSQLPAGAADALLSERPDIANPTPVHFGTELTLLKAELPTRPVRAGQTFDITYTFAAHAPLPGGWKLFAHFEGPGRFLGDHGPPRPMSWWRSGQFIRYTHTVTVPAQARPGEYRLWLGLFRKQERHPARSDTQNVIDDRVDMGTVEVIK